MAQDGLGEPRGRVEGYYDNILGGDNDMGVPRTREEAYLERVVERLEPRGGGGGATEVVAGRNVQVSVDQSTGAVTVSATDTTYQDATATTAGLMSATDKAKLDSFDVPAADAGVAVKAALADYTLAELSAVADEISALGESSGHYAEFRGYLGQTFDFGAFEAGSTLATLCETDSVPELDRHVVAQLIALRHDALAGGTSEKAGLTFLCSHSLPYAYQMNSTDTNAGGWEQSKMRTTLNSGEVWQSLPNGLRKVAVSVLKQTNNVGQTLDESSVTTTSDKIWLASVNELRIPSYVDSQAYKQQMALYEREGTRYEWLAAQGEGDANYSLAELVGRAKTNSGSSVGAHEGSLLADSMYLRSPQILDDDIFWHVNTGGQASWARLEKASRGRGVCLGFCLGLSSGYTVVSGAERAKLGSLGHALTLTVGSQAVTFDGTADASVATPALVACTQGEYDAMASHDPDTWYAIVGGE